MKGWRTVATFVGSGALYLLGWDQLVEWVNPQWIALGTTVVGIVLRLITTGPVAFKKTG